jgi:hypothetical protein
MARTFTFDAATTAVLTQSGWLPSRANDISELATRLTGAGITVVPYARDILTQFNGLTCSPPPPAAHVLFSPQTIFFYPWKYAQLQLDRFPYWVEDLGLPVCPIGGYGPDQPLFVVDSGGVFAGFGYSIWPIGPSFELAMRHLLFADDKPVWWEPAEYADHCRKFGLAIGQSQKP